MKTGEQNARTEIERFDWVIERIQTRVAFGWLRERSGEKNLPSLELSRNQSILSFDVILQHDYPIEQYLLHIMVFFCGKTKRPCFDLLIHWLITQITNTYRTIFQGRSKTALNRFVSFFHLTELQGYPSKQRNQPKRKMSVHHLPLGQMVVKKQKMIMKLLQLL